MKTEFRRVLIRSTFPVLVPLLVLFASVLYFPFPCVAVDSPTASPAEASPSIAPPPDSAPDEGPEAASASEESEETIPDPLEPMNRAFFHFNDKLYFWALKPIARGYKAVLPEDLRIGVRNFYSNLTTPIRLVNCLLQAKWKSAGNEIFRFALNSTLGLAGFLDPAKKEVKVEKTEADFGQTLGIWGVGPACYLNWPILGPSNVRDTVGFAGDLLLDPRTYTFSKPIFAVLRPIEIINNTSLTIGQYESLKKAALDPYIAIREAYQQHRRHQIQGK